MLVVFHDEQILKHFPTYMKIKTLYSLVWAQCCTFDVIILPPMMHTIYFQDCKTCSRSKVQIAHGTQVLGQWPFTFNKPEFLIPNLSPFVKSSSTSKLRTAVHMASL